MLSNLARFGLGLGLFLAMPLLPAAQATESLLDYNVDLASTYVYRGDDVFANAHTDKAQKAFSVYPALQPTLVLRGQGGFSATLWGSFALTDRKENKETGFAGLSQTDELDYLLAYDWKNRLGGFKAGLNYYSYPGAAIAGSREVVLAWSMPFLESIAPTLTRYEDINTPFTYTTLGFGGGESFTWGLLFGWSRKVDTTGAHSHSGLHEVSANVGYKLDSGLKFSFAAVNRPDLTLHGHDRQGNYTYTDTTGTHDAKAPSTLYWLTMSYGGTVDDGAAK